MNAVNPARIANILLFSVGLLLVPTVQAARVQKPYVVDVPVATQTAEERKTATAAGLQQLLSRLSGQGVPDKQAKALVAAGKLESYLLQFGYVKNLPMPVFIETAVATGQAASTQPSVPAPTLPAQAVVMPWRLHLEFSPPAVNALLQENGLALWPLDRPQVQLWMTDDNGVLSAASTRPDVTQAVVEIANTRGVPLTVADKLPVADGAAVPASALQNQDIAQLLPLLPTQVADAFLFARIGGDETQGWHVQWLLHFRDRDYRFEEKGQDIYSVFDKSLQQVAGYLSGNYRSSVTADTGAVQLRLRIDGVQNYDAYTRLHDYLEKLDVVQRVAITQVNGTSVIFDVDAKGRESLRNLLGLFKSLQWQEEIVPPAGSETAVRTVWRYNWQN
ncbi:MAG TPA: DUF2066 domain-containing protein [Pseudomonadales bacterium]|nr:DUF2066 domain-containing protein [Pseudomonadales bacterium]